jgi:hypothetical protein
MRSKPTIEEQARLVKCYVDYHTNCNESVLAALEVNWFRRGGNLSRVVLLRATDRPSRFSFDWKCMVFTFHGNEPFNDETSASETLEIRLNDYA